MHGTFFTPRAMKQSTPSLSTSCIVTVLSAFVYPESIKYRELKVLLQVKELLFVLIYGDS